MLGILKRLFVRKKIFSVLYTDLTHNPGTARTVIFPSEEELYTFIKGSIGYQRGMWIIVTGINHNNFARFLRENP